MGGALQYSASIKMFDARATAVCLEYARVRASVTLGAVDAALLEFCVSYSARHGKTIDK